MPQAIAIALQIISFLAANKDTIKQLVVAIESLIPDAPGATKALAVRNFIGTCMGIEAQLEQIWPFVSPVFNVFVSTVKSAPKAAS